METRLCKTCRKHKPLDRMQKRSDGYYRGECKDCRNQKRRGETRREDPRKRRERKWRSRGIDLAHDEYDTMLAEQGGVCALCDSECSTGKSLAVDHDHDTGEVRGLLCYSCNYRLVGTLERLGLGRVKAAVEYLEQRDWTSRNIGAGADQ